MGVCKSFTQIHRNQSLCSPFHGLVSRIAGVDEDIQLSLESDYEAGGSQPDGIKGLYLFSHVKLLARQRYTDRREGAMRYEQLLWCVLII